MALEYCLTQTNMNMVNEQTLHYTETTFECSVTTFQLQVTWNVRVGAAHV